MSMSNERVIDIRDFKGVFTNADPEDLAPEYLTALENFRPEFGRLVKTVCCGERMAPPGGADQIATFIHSELSGGYLILALAVDDSTNALTVYGWNGTSWQTIQYFTVDVSGTYTRINGDAPVIQADQEFRILPGDLEDEYGMWLGYIDRDFFDEFYSPSAGFYAYPRRLTPPDLSSMNIQKSTFAGAGLANQADDILVKYYKFTYVYDGGQESLLSDAIPVSFPGNGLLKLSFDINKNTHNRRITAIKVYRSAGDASLSDEEQSIVDDPKGLYDHIMTIDLLRDEQGVIGAMAGLYSGMDYIYVPELSSYSFSSGVQYTINLDGGVKWVTIQNPTDNPPSFPGMFEVIGYQNGLEAEEHYWNVSWTLDAGGSSTGESGQNGAYGGDGVAIATNETFTPYLHAGGVLEYYPGVSGLRHRYVLDNEFHALRLMGVGGAGFLSCKWTLRPSSTGLYHTDTSGDPTVTYTFYDPYVAPGARFSLHGEEFLEINGRHARIINGRLWQGNIVIDPYGEKEHHPEWVCYSQLNQYDVTPGSNVRRVVDLEGGPITGIAELFNNVVLLKPQAIIALNTARDPASPTNWRRKESMHNIGNVAPRGYVTAGSNLYVCYTDGIYCIRPNNLAETDFTPTERMRVSDPIRDVYMSMSDSEKEGIIAGVSTTTMEVIFVFPLSAGQQIWAYNTITGQFRQLNIGVDVIGAATDENSNLMLLTSNSIRSFDISGAVTCKVRSKTFTLSNVRKKVARTAYVTYVSPTDDLTLNIYADDTDTPEITRTLLAQSDANAVRVPIKCRAKKLMVEVTGDSSTNSVEIHRIQVEHD